MSEYNQAATADFADQIREHMEVVDASGNHVGTVDEIEGDQIKLTKKESGDGHHHYLPLSEVDSVEDDRITLRERGDNEFGQQV